MFILHQLLFWKGRSQKSMALAYLKTVGKQANKQTIMLFVQKAAAFDDGNSFQLLVWK